MYVCSWIKNFSEVLAMGLSPCKTILRQLWETLSGRDALVQDHPSVVLEPSPNTLSSAVVHDAMINALIETANGLLQ